MVRFNYILIFLVVYYKKSNFVVSIFKIKVMKKAVKFLGLVTLLFGFFSCEEAKVTEYNVKNTHKETDEFYSNGAILNYEIIVDMVTVFELDEAGKTLNQNDIGVMKSNQLKTYAISSSVKSVNAVYRYRLMNPDGSPDEMIYKSNQIELTPEHNTIELGVWNEKTLTENEFYDLINK